MANNPQQTMAPTISKLRKVQTGNSGSQSAAQLHFFSIVWNLLLEEIQVFLELLGIKSRGKSIQDNLNMN